MMELDCIAVRTNAAGILEPQDMAYDSAEERRSG